MSDKPSSDDELSNGWEAVAHQFIPERSNIGARVVREWAQSLSEGAEILDLGCGSGVPISQVLIDAGCLVSGIDASASMVAAYRRRFPGVPVVCEAVEGSSFFEREFDGVVAWGLMFLLPADVQEEVIRKVGRALKVGGRFLFTAPSTACSWADASTGRPSQSLGSSRYRALLFEAGLTLVNEMNDEGENHYYASVKLCTEERN